MVFIDAAVYTKIGDYVHHIVSSGFVSNRTAVDKSMAILNRLNSLDSQFCTDQPSTHPSFGKRQGYLYGFYIDKKANTQWNYLYERFEEDGIVKILVHDICIGGLKDSLKYLSLTQVLTESLENTLAFEMSQVL